MKYHFEVCHRASINERIDEYHERIVDGMRRAPTPWRIKNPIVPFPEFGESHVAELNLNKYFESYIKCSIFYRFRNMLSDSSSSDDRIYFEFKGNKVNYSDFVREVFPFYVSLFSGYKSTVFPEELIYEDDIIPRKGNSRKNISRFYPVSFLDRQLFETATQLDFAQIKQRLVGFNIKLIMDGIMFQHPEVTTIKEFNDFDTAVFSALRIS